MNGLYANGMALSGRTDIPKALIDGQGINFAPRLGIAYQIVPKTVVRAGAGVFYDRLQGNPVFDMLPNPPSTAIPQFYYGNLASIPSAASGAFFPQSVNGFDKAGQIPTTYNWNFTIQRELPWRHPVRRRLRGLGSEPHPVPLQPERNPAGRRVAAAEPGSAQHESEVRRHHQQPAELLPSVPGYANTTAYGFGANSNYHSLQVSANRRFGKSFTFGVAYTWSKAMGTTNDDYTGNCRSTSARAEYDVLSTDRTHVFVANWVYNLPKFIKSDSAASKIGGVIVNDWQISGITTMQSGAPGNVIVLHQRHRQPERALHRLAGYRAARRLQVEA